MRHFPLALCLLVGAAACGGDDDGDGGIDAAPGESADAAAGDDDASTGDPCGGFTGLQCEGDDFCDWADDSCGNADAQGTCRSRPARCDAPREEVCGCDGELYESECAAAMVGVDVADPDTCTRAN